jgi:hypothetical protein
MRMRMAPRRLRVALDESRFERARQALPWQRGMHLGG